MDKKEIIDVLKSEGLHVGEEAAVMAVKAAMKIMALIVPKVSTGLGAMIIPVLAYIEPLILAQLDKIDGEDNPDY